MDLTGITEYSTKELVKELNKRSSVEQMTVAPHAEYLIVIDEDWEGDFDHSVGEGSAVVLVIKD